MAKNFTAYSHCNCLTSQQVQHVKRTSNSNFESSSHGAGYPVVPSPGCLPPCIAPTTHTLECAAHKTAQRGSYVRCTQRLRPDETAIEFESADHSSFCPPQYALLVMMSSAGLQRSGCSPALGTRNGERLSMGQFRPCSRLHPAYFPRLRRLLQLLALPLLLHMCSASTGVGLQPPPTTDPPILSGHPPDRPETGGIPAQASAKPSSPTPSTSLIPASNLDIYCSGVGKGKSSSNSCKPALPSPAQPQRIPPYAQRSDLSTGTLSPTQATSMGTLNSDRSSSAMDLLSEPNLILVEAWSDLVLTDTATRTLNLTRDTTLQGLQDVTWSRSFVDLSAPGSLQHLYIGKGVVLRINQLGIVTNGSQPSATDLAKWPAVWSDLSQSLAAMTFPDITFADMQPTVHISDMVVRCPCSTLQNLMLEVAVGRSNQWTCSAAVYFPTVYLRSYSDVGVSGQKLLFTCEPPANTCENLEPVNITVTSSAEFIAAVIQVQNAQPLSCLVTTFNILLTKSISLANVTWPEEQVLLHGNVTIRGEPGSNTVLDLAGGVDLMLMMPGCFVMIEHLVLMNLQVKVPLGTTTGLWAFTLARDTSVRHLRISNSKLILPTDEVNYALVGSTVTRGQGTLSTGNHSSTALFNFHLAKVGAVGPASMALTYLEAWGVQFQNVTITDVAPPLSFPTTIRHSGILSLLTTYGPVQIPRLVSMGNELLAFTSITQDMLSHLRWSYGLLPTAPLMLIIGADMQLQRAAWPPGLGVVLNYTLQLCGRPNTLPTLSLGATSGYFHVSPGNQLVIAGIAITGSAQRACTSLSRFIFKVGSISSVTTTDSLGGSIGGVSMLSRTKNSSTLIGVASGGAGVVLSVVECSDGGQWLGGPADLVSALQFPLWMATCSNRSSNTIITRSLTLEVSVEELQLMRHCWMQSGAWTAAFPASVCGAIQPDVSPTAMRSNASVLTFQALKFRGVVHNQLTITSAPHHASRADLAWVNAGLVMPSTPSTIHGPVIERPGAPALVGPGRTASGVIVGSVCAAVAVVAVVAILLIVRRRRQHAGWVESKISSSDGSNSKTGSEHSSPEHPDLETAPETGHGASASCHAMRSYLAGSTSSPDVAARHCSSAPLPGPPALSPAIADNSRSLPVSLLNQEGGSGNVPGGVLEELHALRSSLGFQINDSHLSISEAIGSGAYGTVYRGLWQGLSVAVKTLLFSQESVNRKLAMQEAALSMSISHPHIVATYAYDARPIGQLGAGGLSGLMDWRLYIVQEYCDAGTLRQLLEQRLLWDTPIDEPRLDWVLEVAQEVASALQHLHSKNIIHGDLNPTNVLLKHSTEHASGYAVKVADFGLSIVMASGQSHVSNLRQGTPCYAAPEVMSQGTLSKPQDVFSFGVMLWELYHSRTAWRQNPLSRQLEYAPGFPSFGRTCPSSYAQLCGECLRPEPSGRPTFEGVLRRIAGMQLELAEAMEQAVAIHSELSSSIVDISTASNDVAEVGSHACSPTKPTCDGSCAPYATVQAAAAAVQLHLSQQQQQQLFPTPLWSHATDAAVVENYLRAEADVGMYATAGTPAFNGWGSMVDATSSSSNNSKRSDQRRSSVVTSCSEGLVQPSTSNACTPFGSALSHVVGSSLHLDGPLMCTDRAVADVMGTLQPCDGIVARMRQSSNTRLSGPASLAIPEDQADGKPTQTVAPAPAAATSSMLPPFSAAAPHIRGAGAHTRAGADFQRPQVEVEWLDQGVQASEHSGTCTIASAAAMSDLNASSMNGHDSASTRRSSALQRDWNAWSCEPHADPDPRRSLSSNLLSALMQLGHSQQASQSSTRHGRGHERTSDEGAHMDYTSGQGMAVVQPADQETDLTLSPIRCQPPPHHRRTYTSDTAKVSCSSLSQVSVMLSSAAWQQALMKPGGLLSAPSDNSNTHLQTAPYPSWVFDTSHSSRLLHTAGTSASYSAAGSCNCSSNGASREDMPMHLPAASQQHSVCGRQATVLQAVQCNSQLLAQLQAAQQQSQAAGCSHQESSLQEEHMHHDQQASAMGQQGRLDSEQDEEQLQEHMLQLFQQQMQRHLLAQAEQQSLQEQTQAALAGVPTLRPATATARATTPRIAAAIASTPSNTMSAYISACLQQQQQQGGQSTQGSTSSVECGSDGNSRSSRECEGGTVASAVSTHQQQQKLRQEAELSSPPPYFTGSFESRQLGNIIEAITEAAAAAAAAADADANVAAIDNFAVLAERAARLRTAAQGWSCPVSGPVSPVQRWGNARRDPQAMPPAPDSGVVLPRAAKTASEQAITATTISKSQQLVGTGFAQRTQHAQQHWEQLQEKVPPPVPAVRTSASNGRSKVVANQQDDFTWMLPAWPPAGPMSPAFGSGAMNMLPRVEGAPATGGADEVSSLNCLPSVLQLPPGSAHPVFSVAGWALGH